MLFLKKFRDREEEEPERSKDSEQHSKESESESFFRRLLREKDDDEKGVRNEDLANSESFFRRLFEKSGMKTGEEDGFFRRLFRDKHDEDGKGGNDEEESSEFFLFPRLFRIHPEDEKFSSGGSDAPNTSTPENSPGADGFFKRLFRDRGLEDTKFFSMRKEDSSSPSNFLKKLFKDRSDEGGLAIPEDVLNYAVASDVTGTENSGGEEHKGSPNEVPSTEINGHHEASHFRTMDRLTKLDGHSGIEKAFPDVLQASDASHKVLFEAEQSSLDPINCKAPRLTETTINAYARLFSKRPGSPKQRTEKSSSKPPLPKYSSFHLRKGTYHATLDFVQSLCDISSGLVDVFPMEDRRKSLHESLVELNALLTIAQNDGGVCFPMGKGLYRVVHVPEDESTLLNSRDKAPYLLCLEVLKCDEQSPSKEKKDTGHQKPLRGGIPPANGDVQLQRPPPWAYPLWNQPNTHQNDRDNTLRAASQAIDRAMHHSWETKAKYVHVNLSVTQGCRRVLNFDTDQVNVPDRTRLGNSCWEDLVSNVDVNCCNKGGFLPGFTGIKNAACTEDHQIRQDDDRISVETHCEGEGRFCKADIDVRWTKDESMEEACKEEWVSVLLTIVPGVNMEDIDDDLANKRDHRRVPSTIAMAQVKAAADKGEAPPGLPVKKSGSRTVQSQSEDIAGVNAKATDALAGELWEIKKERIKKNSKFGSSPGWDLRSVIVKSGDDCRQELMAVQLVSHFYDIFQEAGLPLWLRPYEVLVTSSYTALIETIADTASIHAIKSRNPDLSSLWDFFCNKYQENSPALKLAQRNFVESMAAYSILCYFLQVKDRHNGNLLIDEEGHIIHIDFGFMLSNSPGGVNFESAPFKLTRELLEVMDSDAEGTSSEFFDYFKVLCIQGFLTCRKHAERIILLVEMAQDSGFPCFKGGTRTIQTLRKRFHLSLTEEQCVSLVLSLISSSLDAWRTRQYDYYQRVLNGIL
eukprot:c29117_g1_i1 orf=1076-3994(-)